MSTRMLIDARHSEETRVAVVKGNRVEDFDYESSNKVQLKGNIYLAKITRVEPSLQAAFVEYGGNRHGFLAFSEIHPDYYQIPVEDREALLAEEAALQAEEPLNNGENEDKDADAKAEDDKGDKEGNPDDDTSDDDTNTDDTNTDDTALDDINDDDEPSEDDDEELNERLRLRRLRQLKRRYKIQEVIKPRQIMLIQVVKEERGNKGAALTSYISLAGRYTVLMPNTTHGGGISRKISNASDRKRLKSIVDSLDIPAGTGCIIRTAGMKRTKTEIKRDVEYIQKIWSNIRELTLKSVAPSMVYEEGNLIKRAIRDLYDRSIDEVQVEGEEGFKVAKEFMTLLMPSHAKRVIHYKEGLPLFQRYNVEEQLDGIFNPNVTLKSGGYIVINPTEALIAIDVNSGKSTKQRNIEATAFKTNLEAAVEIGRQLRLRDLAGLVVIDFIDMEERSHNRKVENKMKEAIKPDRARIMANRISSLGLMEISRQRLRPNLEEASSEVCTHCDGSGRIRNKESAALHVLRAIEDAGFKGRNNKLAVSLNPDVAIYILNKKRQDIISLENKYGIALEITGNPGLISPNYEINASGSAPNIVQPKQKPIVDVPVQSSEPTEGVSADAELADDEKKPRRRRRRGGRGRGKYGRNRFQDQDNAEATEGKDAAKDDKANAADSAPSTDDDAKTEDGSEQKRGRRRGRRGGRRSRYSRGDQPRGDQSHGDQPQENAKATDKSDTNIEAKTDSAVSSEKPEKEAKDEKKKPARRGRKKAESDKPAEKSEEKPQEKPKRKPRAKKADTESKSGADSKPVAEKAKKSSRSPKSATSKVKDVDDKKSAADVKKPKVEAKKPAKVKDKPKEKAKAEAKKADDKPKKKGWWQRGTVEKSAE